MVLIIKELGFFCFRVKYIYYAADFMVLKRFKDTQVPFREERSRKSS